MPTRLHRSSALLVLPAVLLVGVLAGCGAGPAESTPTSPPTTTAAPSEEPTAEPTATPAPTAEPGTPITIGCDELLTLQDVYDFNPNFGAAPGFAPTAGTPVAEAAADNGLACGWTNQTSGELIEVAVAQPSSAQLTARKEAAAAGMTVVPTYGTPPAVEGFFTESQGTGLVQVFTEKYWLVARSPAFFEPGDAARLVEAALAHLPS